MGLGRLLLVLFQVSDQDTQARVGPDAYLTVDDGVLCVVQCGRVGNGVGCGGGVLLDGRDHAGIKGIRHCCCEGAATEMGLSWKEELGRTAERSCCQDKSVSD